MKIEKDELYGTAICKWIDSGSYCMALLSVNLAQTIHQDSVDCSNDENVIEYINLTGGEKFQ